MRRPAWLSRKPDAAARDAEWEARCAALDARVHARRTAEARRQNLVTVVASLASMDQQRAPDAVVSYAVDLLDAIDARVTRDGGQL